MCLLLVCTVTPLEKRTNTEHEHEVFSHVKTLKMYLQLSLTACYVRHLKQLQTQQQVLLALLQYQRTADRFSFFSQFFKHVFRNLLTVVFIDYEISFKLLNYFSGVKLTVLHEYVITNINYIFI